MRALVGIVGLLLACLFLVGCAQDVGSLTPTGKRVAIPQAHLFCLDNPEDQICSR